ncbi:hypothetical protein [Luteibacter yeojuensis]|uniref:Uncharacterized protein n=1 Tax=Luteibacter yeojuensis TaxID=345309 RepID=A0A7X5QU69_9GAMM|nr:hypothetical protein [Luteibacter yeojuensis]NID15375.1 hypothetical protein [Luteibacter yeojuensis]
MNPQGSALLNVDYFNNLQASIDGVSSCEELQQIASDAMASIAATQDAITAELAKLQPILVLLSAPGLNPADIVSWITNFITSFLTPYTLPTVTYVAQLEELASKISSLQAAFSAASLKFPNCHIGL